jgi:uncharacterized CHY-type Zn-finger protein
MALASGQDALQDHDFCQQPESATAQDVRSRSLGSTALDLASGSQLDQQAHNPPLSFLPAADLEHVVGQDSSSAILPAARDLHKLLPEDDGMGILRARILEIQAAILTAPEKAQMMHRLLLEGYTKSQIAKQADAPTIPLSPASLEQAHALGRLDSIWQAALGDAPEEKFSLTEEDVRPTFAPLGLDEEESAYRALGCEHYKRNVKMQCSTCGRWYTCRFCHDKVENHPLIRKDTRNMLCMFCGTAQGASDVCASCGELAALYFCTICKLWDNEPDKNIYHCHDCGICRIGRGIGKDFFHCKVRLHIVSRRRKADHSPH